MVNLLEFKQMVDLLDRLTSPAIVDRALRASGLARSVLADDAGFLPYRLEAQILENVARTVGDADLGARLASEADYGMYDAYARYVLGAKDLAAALVRGRRALSLILPGSEIVLDRSEGYLRVGRRARIGTALGHQHLDDGSILLIGQVIRHFLGPDWRPPWIEVTGNGTKRTCYLESMIGSPVRTGAEMPAVAIEERDLALPNPSPPTGRQIVGFMELPVLMGVDPPETMADTVTQVLRTQFVLGDLSEESVASRLSIGRRTMQRMLKAEATSFREIKLRFIETRARALLAESELGVTDIARTLGYEEPNSFRRAFRSWTGVTPNDYRSACRGEMNRVRPEPRKHR